MNNFPRSPLQLESVTYIFNEKNTDLLPDIDLHQIIANMRKCLPNMMPAPGFYMHVVYSITMYTASINLSLESVLTLSYYIYRSYLMVW